MLERGNTAGSTMKTGVNLKSKSRASTGAITARDRAYSSRALFRLDQPQVIVQKCFDQLRRRRLEEVAIEVRGGQATMGVVGVTRHGDEQRSWVGGRLAQATGQLDAVHARQPQVDQHHMRPVL